MMAALITSIALNAVLAALLLFLRNRHVRQTNYLRKSEAERVAQAIELAELRDAAGFLRFR